ncbi:hypothetical protein AS9A_3423 [Hoyosella subflava DQS3-9A1]|uniref:Uncharacterized protein n=1 Tax=Hoyosella subflava (strain DSM 45089 / JCM 17490 / NBRC 109087 / DQS3-9A1) TaxID=443218 RepID=F6EQ44_HOYSD|nr:hypothetical protein AS9A_3423 [Hoyosella subflava DQS3-9A1]
MLVFAKSRHLGLIQEWKREFAQINHGDPRITRVLEQLDDVFTKLITNSNRPDTANYEENVATHTPRP